MQFYLIVVWFHLKLCTKKDVDCFGQLRERKIWLAYVRLLSLPFLYLIWFTPTNFTVILKPLNSFFKKLDNPEINHQFTYPQGFKDIENKEGNGASNVTKCFPSDFVFSSERPHYSLALFSILSGVLSRIRLSAVSAGFTFIKRFGVRLLESNWNAATREITVTIAMLLPWPSAFDAV